MILTFIETENGLIKKSSFTIISYCSELKEKFKHEVIGIISNKAEENEIKNIEVDSPKVASVMPWRCPLLAFFFEFVFKIVRG